MKDYATGIQHIGVPTKDYDATLDFYKKLGFDVYYETLNGDSKLAFMRLENMVVETYEQADAAGVSGGIDHMAIDVKDIDKVYKEICEMGLNNLNDVIHPLPLLENGIKYFMIKGPNEEKIEFNQVM